MKRNVLSPILFIIFIVGLLVILSVTGVLKFNSVIAPPATVNLDNGKSYWVATYSAETALAGNSFQYKVGSTVNDYTLPDGTIVKPQKSMLLYFSQTKSDCEYVLEQQTIKRTFLLGLFPIELKYYILSNPDRNIEITVCDSNGKCSKLDGTVQSSTEIKDIDGAGSVVVSTQGALMGKNDCANYENVAIVFDDKGNRYIKDKIDLTSKFNSINSWTSLIDFALRVSDNTVFPKAFSNNLVIDQSRTKLTAQLNTLGFGVLTIKADQEYFNSIIYSPPKSSIPSVDSIALGDAQRDSTVTALVKLSNSGSKGNAVVSVACDRCSVSPSSQNILLDRTADVSYSVKASASLGKYCITARACGVSEFGSSQCSTKTKCANVIDDTPLQYCGDGVCTASIGENENTCSKDCKAAPNPLGNDTLPDCTVYNKFLAPSRPVTTTAESCTLGFIACKQVVKNTCENDYTALYLIIGALVVIILGYFIMKYQRKK